VIDMTHIRTAVWISIAVSVVGCGAATSPNPRPPDPVEKRELTKVTFHLPGMNRQLKIL
jgi:hypothetical protein